MAFDWTTANLLASTKRRGQIVSNAQNFTDSDILAIADEEIATYIVPTLISVSEEYLVTYTDIDLVVNQAAYNIPVRAVGRELRDVQINTGSGTAFIQLPRIELERDPQLLNSGIVAGWTFRGDQVILSPPPSASGTLRLYWFNRPNKLVETDAVATISSIDAGRTVITCTTTIPSTIVVGATLDVVKATPGFSTLVMDATATTTTSGTTITVTEALDASVSAGDYVCLAQESPVAQIPPDLQPLLIERTLLTILRGFGDPKAEVQEEVVEGMTERIMRLITPRSKGNSRFIVGKYGPGTSSGWGRFGWRRWY